MYQEKGAITVFLALIFMSLIIFAGAVIDIARIAAADRKVQSALNSSARSVLASYDEELAGEYGIYGVDIESDAIKKDFYRYLRVNLEERHEGISFLQITIDPEDVELHGTDSLLKEAAFKKQVQEYMKYRTPIIAADSLIEQLKNIKLDKKVDFAKSEKTTRDKSRELRTKANEVNAKLFGIKKKMKDLSADKLDELKQELTEALTISGSIYSEEVGGLLQDYMESKEDSDKKAEEGECIRNQSLEFENVEENSRELTPALEKYLEEVSKTLMMIKPLQNELTLKEDKLEDLNGELSKLKNKLSKIEHKDASSEKADEIREKIDEANDKIDEVEEEIEGLEADIDTEISGLKAKLGEFAIEGYTLKEESIQLAEKKAEKLKEFITRTKSEIAKVLPHKLEKEWLISAEEFDLASLVTSEDFNEMDENTLYGSQMEEEEAEKHNDAIVKGMEKLGKAIEEAASGTVEKLNTIEYVMDKYTFLTSKTERNHYFRKGEVEYIISGADTGEVYSQLKNTEYYLITDVLLQVWALRFAIDTIDEFITSVIVFPPQRLAFALAEGALDSSMDIFNMLNGEEIPICPRSFTAVKLKYSDHLKILLLMKPEEEILRKARQLMQVNTIQIADKGTGLTRSDFKLGDYCTIISASAEAKVNLFFLPALKLNVLMPDRFEGGNYIIRKQINMGY